jgi:hypothetical protein
VQQVTGGDSWVRVGKESTNKAFDETGYKIHHLTDEDRERLFYEDEYWYKNYQMSMVSYLKLYIFAYKYSVHQFRDDTMTAILGQSRYWEWYADSGETIVPLACDHTFQHLPRYHQFMEYCTVHFWLPSPGNHTATCLRNLREWDEAFACEVSIQLALWHRRDREVGTSTDMCEYRDLNSCVYHEHLVLDDVACRERSKENAHIFPTIIEA